ncbi:MAG TPA: di-heme oxidoredictase family protein [Gemmataceae bacterium]|nr:di-heme oxidoredictase family protein [Gemmataceae bacterium]
MSRPVRVACYLLVALAVLAPAGLRALTWKSKRPTINDASMAEAGKQLFLHEWKVKDPLADGGDGLGPVFNANSCVACHNQGGAGGGGDRSHNVTTFTVRPQAPGQKPREGVIHAGATEERYRETLAMVDATLPATSQPRLEQLIQLPGRENHCLEMPRPVHVSQRNTPALFGARLIDEIPDRAIIANERAQKLKWAMVPPDGEEYPVGRASRLPGGRIGRFGWKAQTASLADFVQAACANELGLGNPGQAQPAPLGRPEYRSPGLDLTQEQCDQLTAFITSLPRPEERMPADANECAKARAGQKLFHSIGCADCHTPDVGPAKGIYSDLLLHRMGQPLEGGGSYNDPPLPEPDPSKPDGRPHPGEWRTPPLWGVADSAPYLHDGRAATLEEAITLHGGQGKRAAARFGQLPPSEQAHLIAFLKTLRAP